MKKPMFFCCGEMCRFAGEDKVPLRYFPITREYGLEVPSVNYPIGKNSGFTIKFSMNIILLNACPFCGYKLPRPVRKTYFKRLRSNISVGGSIETENDPLIPRYLKNYEWWISERISEFQE